ncbi:TNT domain-containing protein, partial [Listeria seeligeri]|uniref:TNT domain-containing protein n=2 Tax=Listeria seeligeri TaxID=1640 RepID=UPI0022EB3C2A
LGGGKLAIKNAGKQFQGTIDNGIQAGKKALDVRIPNVKKVTDNLAQEAKKKLTQDLDDIGTAAKTIQAKAKEAFQMPPRERLAFAGVGDDISGQTATGTISAAQKKLRDMMSKMDDLNMKGSGTGDIMEEVQLPENMKNWEYRPKEELFVKYEEVYKNPKYFDQKTGEIKWPPDDGFVPGTQKIETLKPGMRIDRYGTPEGSFLAPESDPYTSRALAPHSEDAPYYVYEVIDDFDVTSGEIAPWFSQPGGGTQFIKYHSNGKPFSIEELLENKFIKEIK